MNKLKGRIIWEGYTCYELASILGMAKSTLSLKMSGKLLFDTKEIRRICQLLHIERAEIPDYFFDDDLR